MPRVRLESNGGPSDWAKTALTLDAGQEAELVIPFAGNAPINLAQKDSKARITSNAVSGVTISADASTEEQTLTVQSIVASMTHVPMPDWLGKRPPVEGDWVKTFSDEFDGNAIDTSLWNLEGENYYDQRTHWSKEDVSVVGGFARLKYEKKTGFHNDDPTKKQTAYAAGFLDTFDKWAQKYGYFESRMKLPTASGLWPAFWLMPDRGNRKPGWKRQMTEQGGMEFDVMEHLTGWGPNRYNIAMHWDGYQKNHKSDGTDKLYVQPDSGRLHYHWFVVDARIGDLLRQRSGSFTIRENPRVASVPAG